MGDPFAPITRCLETWESMPLGRRCIRLRICPICGGRLIHHKTIKRDDDFYKSKRKEKYSYCVFRCENIFCKFELSGKFTRNKLIYKSSPIPIRQVNAHIIHKDIKEKLIEYWDSLDYYTRCYSMLVCPKCGGKLKIHLSSAYTQTTVKFECSNVVSRLTRNRNLYSYGCQYITYETLTYV